ncbi:synaptobrevin [Basidiobolus meristosporus CBS 931.73]|uniref:Synaptobrevin n=1 Tax=Basidiobolus meristosporus CBS 931.73 TaxID=1314790 RepID=A0A1Y1YYH4_9FUNG|nr:synaptobrevin [Basidiobolus meristosporus CBS 931.73]|eukprot:ORY03093.1 synaptobrevin [Basidiobolus meristosporus CBS 931.73]
MSQNKAQGIQKQVDEVVGIMQNNVERVMERGEKLDSLNNKADQLEAGALRFKQGTNRVRKAMWWKNMKLKLIIAAIVVIILIAIIVPVVLHFQK